MIRASRHSSRAVEVIDARAVGALCALAAATLHTLLQAGPRGRGFSQSLSLAQANPALAPRQKPSTQADTAHWTEVTMRTLLQVPSPWGTPARERSPRRRSNRSAMRYRSGSSSRSRRTRAARRGCSDTVGRTGLVVDGALAQVQRSPGSQSALVRHWSALH